MRRFRISFKLRLMQNLITILGPTATGKTKLAAALAIHLNGEIISADSRQVYKGMDIGTGKDLDEYDVDDVHVPYHLVDIVNPGYEYNVFEFQKDFIRIYKDIVLKDKKMPILCGGSGFYLDSILRAYEMNKVPENSELRNKLALLSDMELVKRLGTYKDLHNTTDSTDRNRTIRAIEIAEFKENNPPLNEQLKGINPLNFGIFFERSQIRERITERLAYRLSSGMVEEVQGLLDMGLKPDQLMFYGLEYKFVTQYIIGELTYDEMFKKLNTAIHQFAKRQMTWFRRMEKKGVKIEWIDGNLSTEEKLNFVLMKIENKN